MPGYELVNKPLEQISYSDFLNLPDSEKENKLYIIKDYITSAPYTINDAVDSICYEEKENYTLEPVFCKCCNAPVNIEKMMCEYCGTSYRRIKI